MTGSSQSFYDHLADSYHLIFGDWDQAVQRQGETLHELLRSQIGPGQLSVLDCSCGIGTQAIGLARYEHRITATDSSPGAVARARTEASRFGVEISFGIADFRHLEEQVPGSFDAVISCDNSLPHMLTREDLLQAARSIRSKLQPGGLLLASIRDYDSIIREHPTATMPGVIGPPGRKRIYFQVWDWEDDGLTYTLHLFLVHEAADGWKTQHHETRYRAVTRSELGEVLREAGFRDVVWRMPEDTGYYQPIVTARTAA
ncbi:MAG: class I SAM-dependent methyltransferase [Rubrobacteraceae bacterium]